MIAEPRYGPSKRTLPVHQVEHLLRRINTALQTADSTAAVGGGVFSPLAFSFTILPFGLLFLDMPSGHDFASSVARGCEHFSKPFL